MDKKEYDGLLMEISDEIELEESIEVLNKNRCLSKKGIEFMKLFLKERKDYYDSHAVHKASLEDGE